MTPKVIGVYPAAAHQRLGRLIDALTELEPVQFRPVTDLKDATIKALIGIDVPLAEVSGSGIPERRILLFQSEGTALPADAKECVVFTGLPSIDPLFRGRQLPDPAVMTSLRDVTGVSEVLASKGGKPVWARQKSAVGVVDLVSATLPELKDRGFLFEFLKRDDFMRLVPLIHFLHEAAGSDAWVRPPLRANFMFDDPNLHSLSFGYIGFRELTESARRKNYHVSFATIPVDGWYIHGPTAEFFRENKDRLSLLIHGNNHTKLELAQPDDEEQSLLVAAQALKRIARFEERSGVEVARVTVPPHEACNAAMANAMMRLGYEAACFSRGSLMHYNPGVEWPVTIGLTPAAIQGGGFPVLSRFALTSDCRTDLVLAGFLGQPLILVGHHEDVKGGYGSLEDYADFLNGLGPIQWTNLAEIARANYLHRVNGDTMSVKAYSRRLKVSIPASVRRLVVEHGWKPVDADPEIVQVEQAGETSETPVTGRQASMAIKSGIPASVLFHRTRRLDYRTQPSPPAAVWPIVRRVLTESRDRLNPLIGR